MMAGRAFHKLLEASDDGELVYTEVDGFSFRFDLDAEIDLAPIRELKGEMVVQASVGPVTLVGVVDGMNGLTVRDYKLTTRFDAERYADSYQWRSYLEMFGAKKFVYDVFVGKEDGPGEYIIYDYHKLSFYAYDGMKRDIELEVDGLAQIVAKHIQEAA